MQRQSSIILLALGVGVLLTAVTAAASYAASRAGLDSMSEVLYWPNSLLQALVPAPNIGTLDHPRFEGTPLNLLAFLGSFPLATCVYAFIAYVFLRRRKT